MEIQVFKEVVKQYKVVFFDAYGVLKKHNGMIEGVKEMLEFLKDEGIDFYIITNDASRSPELLAQNYHQAGIDLIQAENLVSSAMMSVGFLKENIHPGSTVAYLGRTTSEYFIKCADLVPKRMENITPDDYTDIKCVMLFDDGGYEFHPGINKALNVIRGTGAPVVVPNPDKIYPVSDGEVAVAVGSVANMFEAVCNNEFFHFGKPDVSVFEYAFKVANNKRKVSKRDVLMVGDTLDTDIIGGNNFGIDTVLVLSGSTVEKQADYLIKEKGIEPTYICRSVVDGE
ncbi:HAD-IIA family hydrolase [Plebeiibacterium marinum]|uniref:HAD-IIA family hydrolase n=1 Tax=Plebeiibacterium marinum TaxID=2992111 RepID=A0AAE3MH26_9BACT|nr:HAD-IIA family hydrolase [Plebeiobacterium marinum]MCW3807703.1 HAD-IIA family hydrolase [Plebeiobacterium marinum]